MQGYILLQQQCQQLRSCGLNAFNTPIVTRHRAIGFSRLWSIEACAEWKAVPRRRCGTVGGTCADAHPSKEFFRGIYALAKRWHKCIELVGDYVEQ